MRNGGLFVGALVALVFAVSVVAGGTAQAKDLKPGTTFKDCDVCPTMVVIPPGTFIMGDDDGHRRELPAHAVAISKPFAIGIYEISFDEFDACHAAGGCSRKPHDHKWGRGKQPVINITIADVDEYLKWLSDKTGQTYRLPSEAEWEYAARAGTNTEYFWGDEHGKNNANCLDCGSPWSAPEGRIGTTKDTRAAPVGSFKPNAFGVYDMHGNVYEWTADCWTNNYIGAPNDGSVVTGGDCKRRAARSGSWYYVHRSSRSAWRFPWKVNDKSYSMGMRIARELP